MTQLTLSELTHRQKMDMLQASDWANDFNHVQVEQLANYFKSYSAPSGVTVLKEGENNNLFCLLCEGKIDIVKENAAGEKKSLQILGPGKIFGEVSFFDRSPCSASVITKDEVKLLILDKKQFETLSTEAPTIALVMALNLISSMSQRLRHTTGKLIDLL